MTLLYVGKAIDNNDDDNLVERVNYCLCCLKLFLFTICNPECKEICDNVQESINVHKETLE